MSDDPAKAVGRDIDRLQRQAVQDEARAKTTAARDQYTRNASGLDGGRYKPADDVTDLAD